MQGGAAHPTESPSRHVVGLGSPKGVPAWSLAELQHWSRLTELLKA